MKDILITIGIIIGMLILLGFVLGTVWLLLFAVTLGNTFAMFLILIVCLLMAVNLYMFYKEEIQTDE